MRSRTIAAVTLACGIAWAGLSKAQWVHPDAGQEALEEYQNAIELEPDLENGKRLYRKCAICHTPEGWGTESGSYPQIAGQLRTVIIKQLADIRARNRDNPTMYPFTLQENLGGAQDIADVSAYISQLPMNPYNGKGPAFDLALGESLYKENCAECHGDNGEGDAVDHIPALWGQHHRYLVRQFDWIRMGKRRNADKKMVKQIEGFSGREIHAVMDYASNLKPPPERVAEPGWTNPDFPRYSRRGWHP